MASVHGISCERKRVTSKVVVVTPPTATMPEAPCSVNLFFEVEGYGKAQATGRGLTPTEAAANLQGTIAATRAALAPVPVEPPVRSMEARLSTLLACGLDKAWTKGDEGLGERLVKAARLVRSGAVQPGNREGLLTVRSSQSNDHWYEVEGSTCTCQDWTRHAQAGGKHCCKHVLASMMWARLAEPQ